MKKSIISFVAVIAIIAVLCTVAITGLNLGFAKIPSVFDAENGIRRGLDLVGGSVITFEADLPEDYDMANLEDDLVRAQSLLRSRLDYLGYTEATVAKAGDARIRVEIPAIKNPEEAVSVLGATAQLQFLDADGNTVLTGSDIVKAEAAYGKVSQTSLASEHYVAVQFTSDAQAKFAEATRNAATRTADKTNFIAIVLDDAILSTPFVDQEINSDSCVISGSFTEESAQLLASQINIGQLPFNLEQVELRSVGPQLGEKALSTSVMAALIGVLLVAIFMIVIYRMPGVVSVIALVFYIALVAIILSVGRINLSLPGIAGIILSIGMAVDANVIIFERVKDELRNGKSIRSSIDAGFHRAFAAILDSNITTLIAAAVLAWKGTGTIVGFATTLAIGVVVSMFTAIVITRFLLKRMVDFNVKSTKAYGV
mgnify:CR=1 FL=1